MRYASNPGQVRVNIEPQHPAYVEVYLPEPIKLVETDKAKNAVTHSAVVVAKMLPVRADASEAL
jgi:hypothetical protein